MRYHNSFIKTNKQAKQYDSVNATLLSKGGFIHQTMAGVYTFLPLGWRVLNKIEDIIRQEMDTVGAEMLMPSIVPTALWEKTDRFKSVDILFQASAANDLSRKKNDARYVLSPTHEEVITPIAQTVKPSYKDLPFAVYQIQTKFRNEERPKSGLLRGREFRMKDLYSFHATADDLSEYYDHLKDVYRTIFNRLGLGDDTVLTLASGGDFTDDYSHEFNARCETGEDLVYYDTKQAVYYNKEVASAELMANSEPFAASEVGNIFPLGTKFSKAFSYTYTDKAGRAQPVHMASYGIGTSRVMGVLVERGHDDQGIIWPEAVAPYQVQLVALSSGDTGVAQRADDFYEALTSAGVEVLYDDRPEVAAGEKLKDADLIGLPWRAVISAKTGERLELKRRAKEEVKLVNVTDALKVVQSADAY
ncbi:hypothetical protein IH781_02845 [Patescibacteria group bacterium]|nr:hypothetical protein [Patescibacteria group bacterium]